MLGRGPGEGGLTGKRRNKVTPAGWRVPGWDFGVGRSWPSCFCGEKQRKREGSGTGAAWFDPGLASCYAAGFNWDWGIPKVQILNPSLGEPSPRPAPQAVSSVINPEGSRVHWLWCSWDGLFYFHFHSWRENETLPSSF